MSNPKGNPKGNPDFGTKYPAWKTEREESCTAKLTLRLPPSQYEKLKQFPNWQEKVREAIEEKLAQLELEQAS
jgi:hypothetical protein